MTCPRGRSLSILGSCSWVIGRGLWDRPQAGTGGSSNVVTVPDCSHKAKLSIYQSVYILTLTYSHELWVMSKRIRSWSSGNKLYSQSGGLQSTWHGEELSHPGGAQSRAATPPHWEEQVEVVQAWLGCLWPHPIVGLPGTTYWEEVGLGSAQGPLE